MEEITYIDDNIFKQLGFPDKEAEDLLDRSKLMSEICDIIKKKRIKNKRYVHQPL